MKIHVGGNGYGYGNIGDDAILEGILQIIRSALPRAEITVATRGATRLDFLAPEEKVVDDTDRLEVMNSILECDCFISGGGTMIGDELGTAFPLEHNAHRIVTAKHHGKTTIMLAIGANRLRRWKAGRIGRVLAQHCDLITVRDQQSKGIIVSLGTDPSRTSVTADPAFLIEAKETPRSREMKNAIMSRGKLLGVNVVNEVWADLKTYKACIAKACDSLSVRSGYFPVFFCNEVRQEAFFDHQANLDTAALLQCDHIVLDPVYYSPEEMIDIISCFDCILGMRMHSCVFAALAGRPFQTISRVDKVDNFMALFGMVPSGSIEHCYWERIVADLEEIVSNWLTIGPHVADKIKILKQACLKNVGLLKSQLTYTEVYKSTIDVTAGRYLLNSLTVSKYETATWARRMGRISRRLGALTRL